MPMPKPHLIIETNWPETRADAGGYQVYYATKLNLSNLPLAVATALVTSLERAHNELVSALERAEAELRTVRRIDPEEVMSDDATRP